MTIYDKAVEAGSNASRAVVEGALAEREAATAAEKSRADGLVLDLAEANKKLTDAVAANDAQLKTISDLEAEVKALQEELDKPPVVVPPVTPSPVFEFGVGIDQISTTESDGIKNAYHRTYHSMSSATSVPAGLVSAVEADLNAGRVPVASFKLPGSAADAAGILSGKYDVGFKAIKDKLASYGKPIIVTIHHEPEDDWVLADWQKAMEYAAPRIKSANVEFWIGLMGYHQLYGTSEWKLDEVLIPGVDGYGFDPYLSFGASSTKWTDQITAYYVKYGDWAKANNVKWGIWETGINEQAITSGKPEASVWFDYCVNGAKTNGAVMWIYFNSETTLDGKHNWKLTTTGANKFSQFVAAKKKYNG